MQFNKNPELFIPFSPFFGPNDVQAITGTNVIFSSVGSRLHAKDEKKKHPPGEQQTFGESRFFIGDVVIALGSRA